ncbi:MAG: recombinase family protein [Actinomycetota bacterium]|nr:recombinase family protein [Actinomycetota bacterium]
MAEFERDVIRERTMTGLEAARARGHEGRRKLAMDREKISPASKPHARPRDADRGGVRGGGRLAGDAVPLPASRGHAEIAGGERPASVT